MPFTTEITFTNNVAANHPIDIRGMRVVDGAWYARIVGATVNETNAFPKPGSAVYTVLSGQFDRLPSMGE